jgi:hypothetical protein
MNGVVCKLMRESDKLFEESIDYIWRQENIQASSEESLFNNKKRVTSKPRVKLKYKKGAVVLGEKVMMPMLTIGVFDKECSCDFHEDLIKPFSLDLDFVVNNPIGHIRKVYWPTYSYHLAQINKLNRVSFYLTKLMEKYRDTCFFFTGKQPVESTPSAAQINVLLKTHKSTDNSLFRIVDSCYDLALHLNEGLSVITKSEKKAYDDKTKKTVEEMKVEKVKSLSGYSLNPVIVSEKGSRKIQEVEINERIYPNSQNTIDLRYYQGNLTNKKPRSLYIKRKKSFSKGFYYPLEYITQNKNYYLNPKFIPFVERLVESTNFINQKNLLLNKYRKDLLALLLYLDDNKVDFTSDD